ncbi:hypothetical protein HHK36_015342 [Tetracentron sinense]|uniref:Uncharacterized protein n=1 Tax=Tetracentron sinense TaxID=13715 RepID=A0A834Z5Y7_TETSI|nr:hypothetical protein HHK36_015342 [Tetracentron sinense]
MGRPPCCDKIGVKKGPWTPEEDIILVSFIQEHGPGNWRAVPTNTEMYLSRYRSFILIWVLLKWSHRFTLLSLQTNLDGQNEDGFLGSQPISKGQWERRLQTDIHMAKQALCDALSLDKPGYISDLKASNGYNSFTKPNQASTYASSTENIARLLEGWVRNSPNPASETTQHSFNNTVGTNSSSSDIVSSKAFESLFGFDSPISDVSQSVSLDEAANFTPETSLFQDESKPNFGTQVPFSLLEKWLFDEGVAQGKEDMTDDFSLDVTAELF